jgi:hypothetical protein
MNLKNYKYYILEFVNQKKIYYIKKIRSKFFKKQIKTYIKLFQLQVIPVINSINTIYKCQFLNI